MSGANGGGKNFHCQSTHTKLNRLLLAACVATLPAACRGSRIAERRDPLRREAPAYRIYVTNEASGDLSVIDSARLELVATVPLGKRPRGIHASRDRRTIYVALSGSPFAGPGVDESKLPPPDRSADGIGVFDILQNRLVRVLPSGPDPEQFDLSKDGTLLYVSNEDAAAASIVDLAAGKVTHTLPVGEEPEGVTTSPDGKFAYVTSEEAGAVFVLDTAAAKICEVGNLVAVVDSVNHQLLKTIPFGSKEIRPMGVVVSADGSKAYVSTGRGRRVFVIATATDQISASFEVGERPWGLALSPDGKTLYTANGPSNDVSVVDLATHAVTKKIKVGERPWGVITLPR